MTEQAETWVQLRQQNERNTDYKFYKWGGEGHICGLLGVWKHLEM